KSQHLYPGLNLLAAIQDLAQPPSTRNCKEPAHRETEMCEKATTRFYSIMRVDFNKNLRIRGKPEASCSLLSRAEACFPEFRSMVRSASYFAGVEMLPFQVACAPIDTGIYRCRKDEQGAFAEPIGIEAPAQSH
ncbi:MAG: hypothetical protein JSU94_10360, partial [Phycisphaerales bacterium]